MTTSSSRYASLIGVLQEARTLLARPENDFAWSSWNNTAEALGEIDGLIARLHAGDAPNRSSLDVLFLPTGPIQEVSVSSGWGEEFLAVANRFDAAMLRCYGRDPRELAVHKAQLAAQMREVVGGKLRWFNTIMGLLAVGFAAYLSFSHDTVEVFFPLHLKGPSVLHAMLAAAAIFSAMAIVNWVAWTKSKSRQ